MNNRLAAATVVQRVIQGESLDKAITAISTKHESTQSAVVQALSYGVLRQYELLLALQQLLIKKPLKSRDGIIQNLLLVGLFELLDARTAEHVVVSETVQTVKQQRAWAAGLANACLRRFIRERDQLLEQASADAGAEYLMPEWLLQKIQQSWPDDWQSIAKASQVPGPMVLRVNLSQTSREEYLESLAKVTIAGLPHPQVASALVLETPCDVLELPGFEQGMVSVQDAAAQQAAYLLDLSSGLRVLDACAAPGGKTLHLLEACHGKVDMTAIDLDEDRLRQVQENLDRGGFKASLVAADAAATGQWWDGHEFDRILLDAPCSATGVIRRHPDIKRHRKPSDIEQLCARQARLFSQLWQILAPGGLLLYATCSILPQENNDQVSRFLRDHANAQEKIITATWGRAMPQGRQILPGEQGMDGFYYACIEKQTL